MTQKRVTGTNQAQYTSGTCNRDLAEQKKNSNVHEHKKMIHVFFVVIQVYEHMGVHTIWEFILIWIQELVIVP